MQAIADLLQPMKWSFSTNRTCLAFFGTYFAFIQQTIHAEKQQKKNIQ